MTDSLLLLFKFEQGTYREGTGLRNDPLQRFTYHNKQERPFEKQAGWGSGQLEQITGELSSSVAASGVARKSKGNAT